METEEYNDGGATPVQDEPTFSYDEQAVLQDEAKTLEENNVEVSDQEATVNNSDNNAKYDDGEHNEMKHNDQFIERDQDVEGNSEEEEMEGSDPGTPIRDEVPLYPTELDGGPATPGESEDKDEEQGPWSPSESEGSIEVDGSASLDDREEASSNEEGPASPAGDEAPDNAMNNEYTESHSHTSDSGTEFSRQFQVESDGNESPTLSNEENGPQCGTPTEDERPDTPVQDEMIVGDHLSTIELEYQAHASPNEIDYFTLERGDSQNVMVDNESPASPSDYNSIDKVDNEIESSKSASRSPVSELENHSNEIDTQGNEDGHSETSQPPASLEKSNQEENIENIAEELTSTHSGSPVNDIDENQAEAEPEAKADNNSQPDEPYQDEETEVKSPNVGFEDLEPATTPDEISFDDNKATAGQTAASPTPDSDNEEFEGFAPPKPGGKGSDDEDSDKESADELIADIFGSSDEEEFEGFGKDDVELPSKKKKAPMISDDEDENDDTENTLEEQSGQQEDDEQKAIPSVSDDSDDGLDKDEQAGDFVSDFDLMMDKKKEEQKTRRRKRRDEDIINDNDDLIAELIKKMKEAAEEDRDFNLGSKPAIKKLSMLPLVNAQLKKSDLLNAFVDCGVLTAITEWLAPLPDRSLPHLQIRSELLKCLINFPTISSEGLKSSGIGKAIMYLYKHPKEIKDNKLMAGKLIHEWSRPIFSLSANYKSLSKDEREQRDYEQLPKRRRLSSDGGKTPGRDIEKALEDQKAKDGLKPGDPGFIMRARVPRPSTKDYVVRPESKVDESDMPRRSSKKGVSRYEKHVRSFQEQKKQKKTQRAVGISIEGRKMGM